MGVIYKIRPEIIELVLKMSKEHPKLGCRGISSLIQEQFKISLSKSSVSTILKNGGLGKPVGRVRIHKKRQKLALFLPEVPPIVPLPLLEGLGEAAKLHRGVKVGYWFLKAAELALGGIQSVSKAIAQEAEISDVASLVSKNETLLYMSLFGAEKPEMLDSLPQSILSVLVGEAYNSAQICAHLDLLKSIDSLNFLLQNWMSSCLTYSRSLKFILNDNSFFFLDASGHSLWSTKSIPADFSAPFQSTKEFLNKSVVINGRPLILQAPPGFEAPPASLFNFIESFEQEEDKRIKQIEILGLKNELLESLPPPALNLRRHFFIFGVWPWQYTGMTVEEELKEHISFNFHSYNQDFTLVEGQALLKHAGFGKPAVLRSVAIIKGKSRILTILTNIEKEFSNTRDLVSSYLNRWPNLEIGYQDFLNKIEATSRGRRTPEVAGGLFGGGMGEDLDQTASLDLETFFGFWRVKLNEYAKNHFFPPTYEASDFSILKDRFYELEGAQEIHPEYLKIKFNILADFKYLYDLSYACQRVNEKNIHLFDGKKVFFEIAR